MRRDLMLKAAQNVLPPLSFPQASGAAPARTGQKPHGPETKTTIVAFKYRDGIMCAADRKVSSWGYQIHSHDMVKMWRVSPNSIMLGCGIVGQIQTIRDTLRQRCGSFLNSFGEAISLEGQAKVVARCCQWYTMWSPYDFSFGTILAGMNRGGTFRIISVEEDASRMPAEHYETMGSGGSGAKIALDKGWAPDLDLAAAQHLAVEAIFHAANRDSGSSPIQVSLPTLATVTKNGVVKVTDEQVMTTTAQVLLDKLGIHVDLARTIERERRRRS